MASSFGGPGGPVNLIQYNEQVVAANHPAGYTDVTNRPIEQIMTASGVDFTQIGTNFVGFSIVGHQHHVADIVDFPTTIGGGVATVATKAALFGTTNASLNAISYVLEDNQFYIWNGTSWNVVIGKYNRVFNPMAFGAFADKTVHLISAADVTSHAGIWKGTYTAGVDTWDFVALQESIYAAFSTTPINNVIIWNGNNVGANSTVYIPCGYYVINRPLTLSYTHGGWIAGAGKDSTIIYSTSRGGGTTLLAMYGVSRTRIENMSFIQFPTNPSVNDSLVSMYYDLTFFNSINTGGYNQGFQSNVFSSVTFYGGSQYSANDPNHPNQMGIGSGVNLPATTPNNTAGIGGDNNLFISCDFINCEQGYIQAIPPGALAQASTLSGAYNTKFLSCKFSACRLNAIAAISGSISVDTCEFNDDPGGGQGNNFRAGQQINYGGYDILIQSAPPVGFALPFNVNASTISNCRSSGFQFLNSSGQQVTVTSCTVVGSATNWTATTSFIANDIISGNLTAFSDGSLWQCIIAGTTSISEPQWNTSLTTIVDGTVTWARLYQYTVNGDNAVAIINCLLPQGIVSNQIALIDSCKFSRLDWSGNSAAPGGVANLPVHFNWRSNTVSLNWPTLPINATSNTGFSSWGLSAISAGPSGITGAPVSTHTDPHYYGAQSAILFKWLLNEVGIDYGDVTNNILGVYGTIGRKFVSGNNLNNIDLLISGGLSTGTGVGGSVRLKTAYPGTGVTGNYVNQPVDSIVASPLNGLNLSSINLGQSASPILYNIQADFPCTPGTIVTTAGANWFTQTNHLYGVLPGDIVEAGFTQPLIAGLIPYAVCLGADNLQFTIVNQTNASQAVTAGRVRYAVMRRPSVTGVSGNTAASDVSLLQGDLGGAGNFQCFYDSRINVTTSGSNITKWDDIAGSGGGKGPTLLSGSVDPIYITPSSTFNLVAQANSNSSTLSANSTAFDISGTKTILFGFSFPLTITTQPIFTMGDGTNYLQASMIAGNPPILSYPNFSYFKTSLQTFTFQNIAPGVMIRCGYIQISGTSLSITFFDEGPNSATIVAYPSEANTLTLFGPTSAGATILSAATHFGIMSSNITADQITYYRSWCIAKHNMVSA